MKAKFVNENILKNINENIKFQGHEFKIIEFNSSEKIYVGKEGILGHDNVFISWNVIHKLEQQYES